MAGSGDSVAAPHQQLRGVGAGLDAPALNGHHIEMVRRQRATVIQGGSGSLVDESRIGGRHAGGRTHPEHHLTADVSGEDLSLGKGHHLLLQSLAKQDTL